jgi:hypothetical protein
MIRGFTRDGGETVEKYDYNYLENLPTVDIGLLSLDTSVESGVDFDLTQALTNLGILNAVIQN